MSKCFGFSPQTYFNWKKEESKRPIITLLAKYFTKEDLEEFVETGKISRLEKDKTTENEIETQKKLLLDQTIYSAKMKLYSIFHSSFGAVLFHKGSKDVLIDVLSNIDSKDESYTIENTKQRLIDKVIAHETKLFNIKIPGHKNRLSRFLEDYFSNLEIYVMIKHKDKMALKEVFNESSKRI
ncbi:MAG: hypothetical protein PHE73_09020 [Sulfurovaceae bacterium]|nr:hypothetical protein [Sulfurovaceae bacterium]